MKDETKDNKQKRRMKDGNERWKSETKDENQKRKIIDKNRKKMEINELP